MAVFRSIVALAVLYVVPLQAQMRIVVKDGTGAPVAKAYVSLLRYREAKPPKSRESDPPTVDSTTETDVHGEAVLQVDKGYRYRVEVRCQGFLPWNRDDFRPRGDVLNVALQVGHIVIY